MHNFKWYRRIKPHSSPNVFPLWIQRDFNLHPGNNWRILSSEHEKMSILHQHCWWTMKKNKWDGSFSITFQVEDTISISSPSHHPILPLSLLYSKNGTLKGMRLILIEDVGRKGRQVFPFWGLVSNFFHREKNKLDLKKLTLSPFKYLALISKMERLW